MPVITVKVQTLYPHLFDPGTALYSQPGLVIGNIVEDDDDDRDYRARTI